MTTTASQVATRALRRLRVIAADETAAAADHDEAVAALSRMVLTWDGRGLLETATLDVLLGDGRVEQALIDLLALRLCPDYGQEPTPTLRVDADDGMRRIQGLYWSEATATFDSALIGIPPDRIVTTDDALVIDGGSP